MATYRETKPDNIFVPMTLKRRIGESPGTKLVLRFLTEPTATNYFQQFELIDKKKKKRRKIRVHVKG